MNTKNSIRAVVLVAIVTWPSIETYRLFVAKEQAAASLNLQRTMEQRVEAVRHQNAQVAKNVDPAAAPKP